MASIHELVAKIADPDLRVKIELEVNKLSKQKKFGLVFEEHMPECTPLYDVPVRRGSKVAFKNGKVSENYTVLKIANGVATCLTLEGERMEAPVEELVTVAEFGDPIYPYLQPIDTVCNAPDSDLWHTLIEADNYHALQLLEYLYAGKVDCIYIDPPYNTGARDWKYNNDYVDSGDSYRHSKWLSFMQKRLLLAKKLLNPKDSVLIITIDEKEYLHLGCLLEEIFSGAIVQMITSVIKPSGNRRDREFSRCEEYLFYVLLGNAAVESIGKTMVIEGDFTKKEIRWKGLLRQASNHGRRIDRPNLFYPLVFDSNTGRLLRIGDALPIALDRNTILPNEGETIMWPIGQDGTELTWGLQPSTLKDYLGKGYVKFGKWDGKKRVGYYMSSGIIKEYENGDYKVLGRDEDGALILEREADANIRPLTVWNQTSHAAGEHGTGMIKKLLPGHSFSFPKSVYAVRDSLAFIVKNNPNALIVDFFAGSGTTLHAVNLLNAEDGGHRRCIMVTNNEVSNEESKTLTAQGYHPGDSEWESLGIARYVTWPRTVCSIEGHDVKGNPLKGTYLGSEHSMADGFNTNAAYFKLGFLDKNSVALGRQFREMLPTLWMKAGAHGPCPALEYDEIPSMLILPENRFAVLTDEGFFEEFEVVVREQTEIDTIFIVTDYESAFRSMIKSFPSRAAYQLYRDYLDNFRINTGRN